MGKKKSPNYAETWNLQTMNLERVPINRAARREWARKEKKPIPPPRYLPYVKGAKVDV